MKSSALKVVIIGGGVMGASLAWHLVRDGHKVTLLEKEQRAATGVTAHSYGWVGTSSSFPSDDPLHYEMKFQALADFQRLEQEIGALPVAARGAIVWHETDDETERLITEQKAAGIDLHRLDAGDVARLEPRLSVVPKFAAWAPNDFAVEPILLTNQLLQAAQDKSAVIAYGAKVLSLRRISSRIVGVETAAGFIAADIVVLANAGAAVPLAKNIDVALTVYEKPAVLMRFDCNERLLTHLLYGQETELRPSLDGGLASAEDYPVSGEEGLAQLAAQTMNTIREMFSGSFDLSLRSIHAAWRPMALDGAPLCGFVSDVVGLYTAIAHPGIILAPYLSRMATAEISKHGV